MAMFLKCTTLTMTMSICCNKNSFIVSVQQHRQSVTHLRNDERRLLQISSAQLYLGVLERLGRYGSQWNRNCLQMLTGIKGRHLGRKIRLLICPVLRLVQTSR